MNQSDSGLSALLHFLEQGKTQALREITATRVINTADSSFGDVLFSGDLDDDAVNIFNRVSPILRVGRDGSGFQTAMESCDELRKYAPEFQRFGDKNIDEKVFSIQADPYSYRRFNVFTPEGTYSLRTFSGLHPPRLCMDNIFGGKPLLESMPPAILEREIVRSFTIHEALYKKGVPFHSKPLALVEILSEEKETFYSGQVEVKAFTPLDLAIIQDTVSAPMRLSFMTPKTMEDLADKQGVEARVYLTQLLIEIGRFLKMMNYFEREVSLLSCSLIDKRFYQHFFGEEFGGNGFGGESNLHNFSIDRETGKIALVDDFSSVFPVTTKKNIDFLRPEIGGYLVRMWNIPEDEMVKARNAPLMYFIHTTCLSRPFVRCMYTAGLLSKQEYREHIELVEDKADMILRHRGLVVKSGAFKIFEEIKKLLHEVFPYYNMKKELWEGFNVYTPKYSAQQYTNHPTAMYFLACHLGKNWPDFLASQWDERAIQQRYQELRTEINRFNEKFPTDSYNQFIPEIGKFDQKLAQGKVVRILYEKVMQGYNELRS